MKYTREMLEEAVKSNISIMGVLRTIGVSESSGGMHFHISSRIKKLGIDTSHFRGIRSNYGENHRGGPRKKTIKELLILRKSGPKTKVRKLRKALIEIGIKEECSVCGCGPEWRGQRLVLAIDHKNGNNIDNRKENLRFLCPNCHSQTPTYGRIKTMTAKRFCSGCGVLITRRNKSGKCHGCLWKSRGSPTGRRHVI